MVRLLLVLVLSSSAMELNLYQQQELDCLNSYFWNQPTIAETVECRQKAKEAVLADDKMAAKYETCLEKLRAPATYEQDEDCLIEASLP